MLPPNDRAEAPLAIVHAWLLSQNTHWRCWARWWRNWRSSAQRRAAAEVQATARHGQQVPARARRPVAAIQQRGTERPEIGSAGREIGVAVDRQLAHAGGRSASGQRGAVADRHRADAARAAQDAGRKAHRHLQRTVDQQRAAADLGQGPAGDGATGERIDAGRIRNRNRPRIQRRGSRDDVHAAAVGQAAIVERRRAERYVGYGTALVDQLSVLPSQLLLPEAGCQRAAGAVIVIGENSAVETPPEV